MVTDREYQQGVEVPLALSHQFRVYRVAASACLDGLVQPHAVNFNFNVCLRPHRYHTATVVSKHAA